MGVNPLPEGDAVAKHMHREAYYMPEVSQKYAPKSLVADTGLAILLRFKYYCTEVMDGVINDKVYAQMEVMSKSDDEDEN